MLLAKELAEQLLTRLRPILWHTLPPSRSTENKMNRSSLLIGIGLVAIAAAACSGDKKLELGGSCTLNSDCTSPGGKCQTGHAEHVATDVEHRGQHSPFSAANG
jgi:hypothetical protein